MRNESAGYMDQHWTAPLSFLEELSLTCNNISEKAVLCGCRFDEDINFDEVSAVLGPEEKEYFNSLKFSRRKTSFLLGRHSAKKALAAYYGEQELQRIVIKPGVFNHPVVLYPNRDSIQVTITHCDFLGAAIAYPETFPMGIDIEKTDTGKVPVMEQQATEREKEKLSFLPLSYENGLTFLWTAKEALSKIMKTGLTAPFHLYELENMAVDAGGQISGYFTNFPQYKAIAFSFGVYIFTVAYPKNAELNIGPVTADRLSWLFESKRRTAV